MANQSPDPLLQRLARMNRTAVFLAALAVGIAGFFLPGVWGGLLLYAVAFGLAWLLSLTFAVTPPPLRAMRVLIIALLVAVATFKIT
jgi:hypothetical protein